MKFTPAIVLMSLISLSAYAETCVVTVPMECLQIQGSEFSTGGGTSSIQYIEVDCNLEGGRYKKYIATMTSWAGAFGVGRAYMPKEMEIVRGNVSAATITCK
jgi:hypothetical protein